MVEWGQERLRGSGWEWTQRNGFPPPPTTTTTTTTNSSSSSSGYDSAAKALADPSKSSQMPPPPPPRRAGAAIVRQRRVFAVQCPYAAGWQDALAGVVGRLFAGDVVASAVGAGGSGSGTGSGGGGGGGGVEWGWGRAAVVVDGVYIDQVGAAAPESCSDPSHGHALGGEPLGVGLPPDDPQARKRAGKAAQRRRRRRRRRGGATLGGGGGGGADLSSSAGPCVHAHDGIQRRALHGSFDLFLTLVAFNHGDRRARPTGPFGLSQRIRGYYLSAGAEFFQSDLLEATAAMAESVAVEDKGSGTNHDNSERGSDDDSDDTNNDDSDSDDGGDDDSGDVFAAKLTAQFLAGVQLGWFSLGGRDNQDPAMGLYEA